VQAQTGCTVGASIGTGLTRDGEAFAAAQFVGLGEDPLGGAWPSWFRGARGLLGTTHNAYRRQRQTQGLDSNTPLSHVAPPQQRQLRVERRVEIMNSKLNEYVVKKLRLL
jgi:hypothetical protein